MSKTNNLKLISALNLTLLNLNNRQRKYQAGDCRETFFPFSISRTAQDGADVRRGWVWSRNIFSKIDENRELHTPQNLCFGGYVTIPFKSFLMVYDFN